MLLRDLVLRRGCCWPSLLLHCALHPLWGFVQVTHGEPQKSCSKVTDSCQHVCQCRPPPPLPPPPPPPPPPRLLSAPGKHRLAPFPVSLCVFRGPERTPEESRGQPCFLCNFPLAEQEGSQGPTFPCSLQNAFP
uniref:Uncharacterized protein n=1 Tax=Ovis aries TaxID=9940 RepID=A0AC11C4G2_SHEEP